jgi:hypothetical protein
MQTRFAAQQSRTASGWPTQVGRLLAFVLAVIVATLLGIAVWSATSRPAAVTTQPPVDVVTDTPTGPATTDHGSHAAAAGTAVHGRGNAEGYEASVHLIPAGVGTDRTVVLEVDLTVEATPASAPAADAELRGSNGSKRAIKLLATGAGQWKSDELLIPAGRYTLTSVFHRQGHPLTIPVAIKVP